MKRFGKKIASSPESDEIFMKTDDSDKNAPIDDPIVDPKIESAWRAMHLTLQVTNNEAECGNLINRLLGIRETDSAMTRETAVEKERSSVDQLGLATIPGCDSLGTLGPYTIQRVIGVGGMSTVFKAYDERLGRFVAIKVHSAGSLDPKSHARFAREARSQAAVNHPCLLPIYDVSVTSTGIPYLVTELATFGSWKEYQDRHSQAESDRQPAAKLANLTMHFRLVARVIASVADGLAAAHSAGVVHRDIKPTNILLCQLPDGSQSKSVLPNEAGECDKLEWLPKLSDFGLARPLEDSEQITQSAVLSGTPAYMSPEQIVAPDNITAATDVYSLGVTLYESLTGEVPFRGATHAVLQQIVHDEPPCPSRLQPQIPPDLDWVCMKAMSRDPGCRYRSAAAFADDLRNWLDGRPVIAKPPKLIETFAKWCRRNPRVAMLSVTVLGLMLVITIGSLSASFWIFESQRELQKRTKEAEDASMRAVNSAEFANQQRMVTLDTLNELVVRVQDQLEKRPDTLEIRESLLNKAFEGLEKVTSSLDSDSSIDRTIIDAHIRMSSIKLDQGDRNAAIKHTTTAVELADIALKQKPNDVEAWRDFANALARQFQLNSNAFAYEQSAKIAERLIMARSKVCELTPYDAKAKRALIAVKQWVADQLSTQGKLEESLKTFRELIIDLSAISTLPDPIDTRRDQVILNSRVGVLNTQLTNYAEANNAFDRAVALNSELLGEDGANVVFRNDRAFLIAKLSLLKSAMKQHEDAVRLAKDVLHEFTQLAEDDSKRIQSHTLVGTAYDLLYQIYMPMKEYSLARDAEMKSYDTAMLVAEMDLESSRHLLLASEAAGRVSDLFRREGNLELAATWAEKSYQKIDEAKGKADFDSDSLSREMHMAKVSWDALQLAKKGEGECRANLELNPEVCWLALAELAYQKAIHQEFEKSRSLLDELMSTSLSNQVDQTMVDIMILRSLAHCFEILSGDERQKIQGNVVKLAKRSLEIIPQLRNVFRNDPDFEALRETEIASDLWH
jgi:serine/threonine protein kinase